MKIRFLSRRFPSNFHFFLGSRSWKSSAIVFMTSEVFCCKGLHMSQHMCNRDNWFCDVTSGPLCLPLPVTEAAIQLCLKLSSSISTPFNTGDESFQHNDIG